MTCYFVDDSTKIEEKTVFEALLGKVDVKDIIIKVSDNLYLAPADLGLAMLTYQLSTNRDYRLYSIPESIKDDYDCIVLDTPKGIDLETR